MKIAIQGHLTRGKEVIQILESLGGKNDCPLMGNDDTCYYYIDITDNRGIRCHDTNYVNSCKKYTLEKFEKEFPFKIGDIVTSITTNFRGIITNLKENGYYYVRHDSGNLVYVFGQHLKLYKEMKEERNVTLTLDKAKEWYKKGGELKEIALQAFTENELNPLPRSWEEYCRKYGCACLSTRYANIPLKYDALLKLEQLRDCWRQGWVPNWLDDNETKYVIIEWKDKSLVKTASATHSFLSFPNYILALEFQECFKDLIEKAGDLI